jgi:hypothetical protein
MVRHIPGIMGMEPNRGPYTLKPTGKVNTTLAMVQIRTYGYPSRDTGLSTPGKDLVDLLVQGLKCQMAVGID